ncbi:galactose-3-O-sulfotransferase 3-like [Scylla paramamosain]|uniref:galactose-3-O-sulfotransferase 3-like n=1 Tax=Scylla paramamosain TaxID=85552 RepID=UPI0030839751
MVHMDVPQNTSGLLSFRDLASIRGFDSEVHFMMFKALQEVFLGRPVLGFWDGVSSPPPSPNHAMCFFTLDLAMFNNLQVSWNILFRYGEKHKLYFALLEEENYFGDGKRTFKADMVWSPPLDKVVPNIFAIHTRWDHTEEKKVMPEDSVFFTIVWEPTALFLSLFDFYNKTVGVTLDQYVKQVPVDGMRILGYLGYNQMSWDFGMSLQHTNNLSAVREMSLLSLKVSTFKLSGYPLYEVNRVDEQFGLVLVADRMGESLVLLANYLCWELSDVLVLRVNTQNI